MCKKHPEAKNGACGEFVCGMCYAEALLAEPYRPVRSTGVDVDEVYRLMNPHYHPEVKE